MTDVIFEVNKTGLVYAGELRSVGDNLALSVIGKNWRALLSAGKIRRLAQPSKEAFRHHERFKRESLIYDNTLE